MAIIAFAALAILLLWATAKILAPYITPIILAGILATFTHPVYRRLRGRLHGRKGLAALIMLLGITLVLVIPAFLLTLMLINQATGLLRLLETTDFQKIVASLNVSEKLSWIHRFAPGFDTSLLQPGPLMVRVLREIPGFIAAHGTDFVTGFAGMVVGFFMMLIATYFFYTEGEWIAEELMLLSPLPDQYDREIFAQFRGVVDATFRGQILTALAQGAVTGVGLAVAGVPAPILWAAVAALASLIPMVGAAGVWVPATIYLFAAASMRGGSYGWAIFMLLWGILAISTVDNLIRPWAMKAGMNMQAIVLFFAILGGISAFGFVGILIGPLVFALLVTVVGIYKTFLPPVDSPEIVPLEVPIESGPIED